MIHVDLRGKSVPGRGNSKDRGPEARAFWLCWRNSKEVSEAGAESGGGERRCIREAAGPTSREPWSSPWSHLSHLTESDGSHWKVESKEVAEGIYWPLNGWWLGPGR